MTDTFNVYYTCMDLGYDRVVHKLLPYVGQELTPELYIYVQQLQTRKDKAKNRVARQVR